MRSRALPGFVLLSLFALFVAPAPRTSTADFLIRAAEEKPAAEPFKPAVLLRLDPLDTMIGDLRYLAKQIGQDELAKQVEGILKGRTGPKGLEGVHTKKPIGLYGSVSAKLDQSEVMLLLPIASEKEFLAFLDALDFKPEKGKDGLYTMQVENVPFPLLFRFANGYLYGTLKSSEAVTVPAPEKLPKPETVLAGGGSGLLSLTVNVDQLPAQIRKVAVSFAALHLGEQKEKETPGETEKQAELRKAILDELSRQFKSLLEDATAAQLRLAIDRKSNDLSASFSIAGKDGSALAKNLASLGSKSLAAGLLGSDSAMGGLIHLSLPESVRKHLAPVIDEGVAQALGKQDAGARELLAPIARALTPTAKAATLDFALDMRGPGKGGKYTLVAGMRVEKGLAIEKALKDLIAKLPEEARAPIKLDAARAGEVNVHEVKQKDVNAEAKELFGTGPLYLALRDDAVFVTLGEDALATMKETVTTKPKDGQTPVRAQMALGRIARLLGKTQKGAGEAAPKAFAEKDNDAVKLEIRSGKQLEVSVSVKAGVLHFAALLDEARKKKAKEEKDGE